MSSQEQELFSQLLAPHSRRNFLKRAGALSLSGAAFAVFRLSGPTTRTF